MGRDIKNLHPQANGRYQQGYIDPSSCKKLYKSQSNQPIIFRSSWERKFVYWLETNDSVKNWASECSFIPYMNVMDKKEHKYYPDFIVEMVDGTKILVEIKPYNQTIRPISDNDWAMTTYVRNMCKWKAAKQFCENHGMKFQILTERTIEKL